MRINESLLKFLGLNTQGDLGPWTFYTSKRHGLVWFPKSPPLQPPSYLQTRQRNLFRNIANLWNQLSDEERELWMRAATLAHLSIHGYNLFVYVISTSDRSILPTIERNSGITLPPISR